MITFEKARDLIEKNTEALDAELVELSESVGRVLASDIISDIDMPPFDKAAMDGYAVRSADCEIGGTLLRVVGEVRAGSFFPGEITKGEAVAIMTGAPVPSGADSVVMVEKTEALAGDGVKINEIVRTRQNICIKAEDVSIGTVLLREGTQVRGAEVPVLASAGYDKVNVVRPPRVSVIATGDELVPVDKKPGDAQIRNCNGPTLVSMLKRDGCRVDDMKIVSDERNILSEAVKSGLKNDVLLLTGGVSVGRYDLVPEIMKLAGVKTIFHGVNVKPGKPLFYGIFNDKCVFGMPGNPMAVFLAYHVFVRPALKKMMGLPFSDLQVRYGRFKEGFKLGHHRKTFIPVFAECINGCWVLSQPRYHGSADIFSLTRSSAFAIVSEDVYEVSAETDIEFFIWHE